MDLLQERLADAGLHAMRIRAGDDHHKSVVLEVLPVGIEVCVRSYGREQKALLGWLTITESPINPIIERIEYLSSRIDKR